MFESKQEMEPPPSVRFQSLKKSLEFFRHREKIAKKSHFYHHDLRSLNHGLRHHATHVVVDIVQLLEIKREEVFFQTGKTDASPYLASPAATAGGSPCNTGRSFRWRRGAAGRSCCGTQRGRPPCEGCSARRGRRRPGSSRCGTEIKDVAGFAVC